MSKRIRGVKVVSYWMLLSSMSGIFYNLRYGVDESRILFVVGEWLFYAFMISGGIGLAKLEEWGRKMAIWLFGIFFAWMLYVIYILLDSSKVIVESLSQLYNLSPLIVKSVVLGLFVAGIVWPIIVIQFFTHPKVKAIFHPDFDPITDKEEL